MGTRPPVFTDIHVDTDTLSTVGTTSGITMTQTGSGNVVTVVIDLDGVLVTMTDGTTNGNIGSVKLFDMPAGVNAYIAAQSDFLNGTTPSGAAYGLARTGSGISATATLKHSVGTAAEATDDTLNSTQANIIASTSVTLASGAGTVRGTSSAPIAALDQTSGGAVYLNFGVADAGSTGNDVVRVRGRVTVSFITLGA